MCPYETLCRQPSSPADTTIYNFYSSWVSSLLTCTREKMFNVYHCLAQKKLTAEEEKPPKESNSLVLWILGAVVIVALSGLSYYVWYVGGGVHREVGVEEANGRGTCYE